MKALSPFAERVLATVAEHELLSPGDRVVAAVSGGPDSMALLEALVELRERLGLSLGVAHLHHGLRGRAADADAEFVAARAAALGLPVTVEKADVAAERRRRGGSVELAARRVRYEFFARVAAKAGATRVAVGHTADDQVETIVAWLLRGGELRALCGMPASRPLAPAPCQEDGDEGRGTRDEGKTEETNPSGPAPPASGPSFASRVPRPTSHCLVWVVRPLIERTRAEVVAYLAERGVAFRTDESNEDVSFERNWIRHAVLPGLDGRSGGRLRDSLLGMVGRARDLADLVEGEGRRLVRTSEGEPRNREGASTTDHTEDMDKTRREKAEVAGRRERRLRVGELARKPSLVRRAAVREAFAQAAGSRELAWRAVDAVEGLLEGGSGREVRLPAGVVARRSYGDIIFSRGGKGRAAPVDRALRVPGRTEAPEVGLWVEAQVVNDEWRMTNAESMTNAECRMRKEKSASARRATSEIRNPESAIRNPKWEEVVDLDQVGEDLVVRTRRPGDRFQPLGLRMPKKLKDFLMDQRVPRDERERTLVVEGRAGIVWVVGRRLDERAKVTAATRRVARLRAGPLGRSQTTDDGRRTTDGGR